MMFCKPCTGRLNYLTTRLGGHFICSEKSTLLSLFKLACRNPSGLVATGSHFVYIHFSITFDHNDNPSVTHSFDTGKAWESLALQGSIKAYVAHGRQRFNYERVQIGPNIPETF